MWRHSKNSHSTPHTPHSLNPQCLFQLKTLELNQNKIYPHANPNRKNDF